MISPDINKKIAEALKAHDEVRLSTLRMLSSAFNYEKIAKQHDLTEEEEIAVVKHEAKKRTEALEALRQAQTKSSTSDPEVIKTRLIKEQTELEILRKYLPLEMTDEELSKIVNESLSQMEAKGMQDFGRVMGDAVKRVAGRADGGRIAALVKGELEKL